MKLTPSGQSYTEGYEDSDFEDFKSYPSDADMDIKFLKQLGYLLVAFVLGFVAGALTLYKVIH